MTTHHSRPVTAALAAALGLALGVLLARHPRQPRHPPASLRLLRHDVFEASLLRDLATQRPPAQQLTGVARPIPRGR